MDKVMPQVAISELRKRQGEILKLVQGGPIVLTTTSRPAGVLVDVKTWNELVEAARKIEQDQES